jgi:hypothetical protein
VAAHTVLSKVIALILIGLASGSHELSRSAVQGVRPNGHRAYNQLPTGGWQATGRGFETDGPGTGEIPRTFPGRRWRFVTNCRGSSCRTLFLRTTPGGIQRTVLHPHRGYFTATFGPTPQRCEGVPGKPGNYTAHFRLRWSKDGNLVAGEHGFYGGNCTPGWTSNHWTATPAPASEGVSEASEQVL